MAPACSGSRLLLPALPIFSILQFSVVNVESAILTYDRLTLLDFRLSTNLPQDYFHNQQSQQSLLCHSCLSQESAPSPCGLVNVAASCTALFLEHHAVSSGSTTVLPLGPVFPGLCGSSSSLLLALVRTLCCLLPLLHTSIGASMEFSLPIYGTWNTPHLLTHQAWIWFRFTGLLCLLPTLLAINLL